MNSGRKIKDKLSHLINRWLFLKKQGTDDYLLTPRELIEQFGERVLRPSAVEELII